MIRLRILKDAELAQAKYDGVPALIPIEYIGRTEYAVLEESLKLEEWAVVELETP